MNVNGFTRRRQRMMVRLVAALAVFGAGSFGSGPARCATVKRFTLTPAEAQVFHQWTNFLSGGTQTWSRVHAPAFTPQIRSTIWQVLKTDTQAQSLANPMIDYLLWRQSLHPRRFASYHPNLSPALSQLLKSSSPSLPPGVPPPTYTPVPQTTTTSPQGVTPPLINPSPQGISPAAIPEPSSFLLGVGMTGLGLWWRRRLVRSA